MTSTTTSKTVLVTGASGFVALHVIGQLLAKGYSVVGTVRNEQKKESLLSKFTAKLGSTPDLELVIVKDIAENGAFDELFESHKNITVVLHTASPFSFGFTDLEAGYLKPAVEGTLNVLKSIQKFGPQVTNVVVTSSTASVLNRDKLTDKSFIHTEDTWNPVEWSHVGNSDLMAYVASKKLAERSAWDFIKENHVNFQLNTITPPYIFGPQYFDEDAKAPTLNTSCQVVKALLDTDPNDTKLFNDIFLVHVDVRDVAAFHILAFETTPSIGNCRLTPIASHFSQQLILNIINENFPQLQGKIAKGQPEGAAGLIQCYYDISKSVEKLGGYKFIPLEKTIVDSVAQIIKE